MCVDCIFQDDVLSWLWLGMATFDNLVDKSTFLVLELLGWDTSCVNLGIVTHR